MQTLEYQSPREVPVDVVHSNAHATVVTLCLIAVVLSAMSLFVVLQGATDEPYMAYRRYDALVQVGFGTAFILLWCCYALFVGFLLMTRKLSLLWLLLIGWAAVCIFYLSFCPLGYVSDLERFILPGGSGG